ncbi:hypothetical protein PanWU01x14_330450 [Parasponia andersonii]|uniref:Uncharacterized protein n=1 Tax=Parasponia andersonii TaxID=3476 RepID=A0A2P5AHX9_PARAD|nr:hypothetical protein PanWU01x14_330450 [Parasponia andersonii]
MAPEVQDDDITPEKEHDNATNIASSSTSFINQANGNTQRNKIFVGGLPHDLQEHEFRSHGQYALKNRCHKLIKHVYIYMEVKRAKPKETNVVVQNYNNGALLPDLAYSVVRSPQAHYYHARYIPSSAFICTLIMSFTSKILHLTIILSI